MSYKNGRVDVPLTNMSVQYIPEGFIANQVLTPLTVRNWTGIIPEYGNEHLELNQSRVLDRGPYHTVQTVSRKLTDTYTVHNHGLKDYVTERDMEEIKSPFQARRDVAYGLKNILMTEKEYEAQSELRKTSNYNANNVVTLTSTSQWDQSATSDPIDDIRSAKVKVFTSSKKQVNCAIIPYEVMQTLRFHPKLTGIYGQSGTYSSLLTDEQVGRALQIPKIIVPMAAYLAGDTETSFWGKDVILLHQAPTASRYQRTYGYRITKAGHESRVFSRQPTDMPNGELIFSDMAYQYKVQNKDAGYLIKSAVA